MQRRRAHAGCAPISTSRPKTQTPWREPLPPGAAWRPGRPAHGTEAIESGGSGNSEVTCPGYYQMIGVRPQRSQSIGIDDRPRSMGVHSARISSCRPRTVRTSIRAGRWGGFEFVEWTAIILPRFHPDCHAERTHRPSDPSHRNPTRAADHPPFFRMFSCCRISCGQRLRQPIADRFLRERRSESRRRSLLSICAGRPAGRNRNPGRSTVGADSRSISCCAR